MSETKVLWEYGTAYELFVSLHVLHEPEHYGVRASWAAGIRSRIPAEERKFLEEVVPFLGINVAWVTELPEPKDAMSALWGLRQIPAAYRLSSLMNLDAWKHEIGGVFLEIMEKKEWTESQLEQIAEKFIHEKPTQNKAALRTFLDWCAKPEECGEFLFNALQAYYKAFFDDEEKRIAPILEAGLEKAKQLAVGLELKTLMQELSQGVAFDDEINFEELIFIPAFWTTPLVLLDHVNEKRGLFLFGVRPANMAAVPGELIPDGLVRTLKALADPTRLKILHDISQEALTPSELARRLNLRAPTVTHHLSELRLAGLVNVNIKGQEKFFKTRDEALQKTFENLNEFLKA